MRAAVYDEYGGPEVLTLREVPDPSSGPDEVLVTLHLDAEAGWAVDYYPVRAVRPAADGGHEVDLVVVDRAWLDRLLLRLAPHARVVAPQEFIDTFLVRARETLGLYQVVGRSMVASAQPEQ